MSKNNIKKPDKVSEQKLIVTTEHQYSSGPIPHAEELAKYEQICPGLADRIMKMAENPSAHRQQLEKDVVAGGLKGETFGKICGLVIVLATIAAGTFLAHNGNNILGIVFPLAGISSVVAVFIYGTKSKKKEMREQRENLNK